MAMTILTVYLVLALGVSFLCSLLEAGLLSLQRSYIAVLVDQGRPAGPRLFKLTADINRPLAAILTLNTFAHTLGAAGVGAQAAVIWGEAWVGLVGFVVTVLILVLSEIVPKTLGAVHAERLAGFVAGTCMVLIRVLYPAVVACTWLSRAMSGPRTEVPRVSRDELRVFAGWAQKEGAIDPIEARIIRNMIALREVAVSEVMTPRIVVATLGVNQTIGDIARGGPPRFSRVPIIGASLDEVRGIIHRQDLVQALSDGDLDRTVGQLAHPVHAVPMHAKLPRVFRTFLERREHLFLVVDEYGGGRRTPPPTCRRSPAGSSMRAEARVRRARIRRDQHHRRRSSWQASAHSCVRSVGWPLSRPSTLVVSHGEARRAAVKTRRDSGGQRVGIVQNRVNTRLASAGRAPGGLTAVLVNGTAIEFDKDGFMVDPDLWDDQVAQAIARDERIDELTDVHWTIVRFIRDHWKEHDLAPPVRLLCQTSGVSVRQMFKLFTSGPARGACRVAGLPKPDGCV
jgi:TusE/DsrC/DsvC family sulfur relay protein